MAHASRFGIAAALALISATAWAGDERSDDKASSAAPTIIENASTGTGVAASGMGGVVEAGTGSAMPGGSNEVRASEDAEWQRWLREREGLRDGGY